MTWKVYLSGEIHTDWRQKIKLGVQEVGLPVSFSGPVLDHEASDECGSVLLGTETDPFWRDNKGASINAIRTRKAIKESDLVVVRFGEQYRQWNAAFEAGYAAALGKSLVVIHAAEFIHALKEVDSAALAVVQESSQVVDILTYVISGRLPSSAS